VGNRRLLAPIRNGGKIIDVLQKLLVISHRKNHRRLVTGFVCQILKCCTHKSEAIPKRGFCRGGSRKRFPKLALGSFPIHELLFTRGNEPITFGQDIAVPSGGGPARAEFGNCLLGEMIQPPGLDVFLYLVIPFLGNSRRNPIREEKSLIPGKLLDRPLNFLNSAHARKLPHHDGVSNNWMT